MGAVAKKIIQKSGLMDQLIRNIAITTGNVVEVADLITRKEVDCGIIWQELLAQPQFQELRGIQLPADINEIKEIRVAVLTTSQDKESAQVFADFVALEGKAIFQKHGFIDK